MANKNKKTILIIEDDEAILSMYKTKLEKDGFNVLVANNGYDGLELIKKKKPNIVLLDIILPQIDGFSVLGAIRDDAKIKDTPVIILTNLSTEEDKIKGKILGVKDYLVKANLTPAEVSKKVKEYIKESP